MLRFRHLMAFFIALSISGYPSANAGWFSSFCQSLLFPSREEVGLPPHEFPGVKDVDLSKSSFLNHAPAKQQSFANCCAISSVHARYERDVARIFKKSISLSDEFHILTTLLFKIEDGLYNGNAVLEGGWPSMTEWMVRRFGLYPSFAWKPRIDLFAPFEYEAIVSHLNREIAHFQTQLRELRQADEVRFSQLEGADLESAKRESNEQAMKFANETRNFLSQYLFKKIGLPPPTFVIDGKFYTPLSLYRKVLSSNSEAPNLKLMPLRTREVSVALEVDAERRTNPNIRKISQESGLFSVYPETASLVESRGTSHNEMQPLGPTLSPSLLDAHSHANDLKSRSESLESIHAEIFRTLSEKRPVYLAIEYLRDSFNHQTGIVSVPHDLHGRIDRNQIHSAGLHAMLITGVYRNSEGSVLGYLAENSYGDRVGVQGYFFIEREYFDLFLENVTLTGPKEKRRPL
ncbi:MAG: hypothetical protein H7301_06210 [Cryobacterium sp.]|nr:hypothetical protein [Oligoflexia bacterium]